ncbi:Hsp20 family protein [Methylomonas sp. UP202]|uniref:Hsp20 family protein n=1 Tax=Methylomonas sp. UP202 TaxID=3040943 RepID=UPI00247940E3|nr:Hsp20 family protein [Methylomonas sp. UP202]WGS87128.1 Hsp20 family protein [Methylomonas sp. UP202]
MMRVEYTPIYRPNLASGQWAAMLDGILQTDRANYDYPPYDIELVEDKQYAISLAVAGFSPEQLTIETENKVLIVKGEKPRAGDKRHFLHQGIVSRNFERRFNLAEHIEVAGAHYRDGILTVRLTKRVPEAMKPRRIEIDSAGQVLSHDAAEVSVV